MTLKILKSNSLVSIVAERQAQIIIVEDDTATREALSRAIQNARGFDVVASCATYKSGAAALSNHDIDVLVTDLDLPDGNGIDLIRATRKQHPQCEIMVISILGDETSVVSAISAGASGFLLKDTQEIDIITAISDLLAGNSPISTAVARYIIKLAQNVPELVEGRAGNAAHQDGEPGNISAKAQTTDDSDAVLTARELDILWGIAKGFTYKDVAERLELSPHTIPSHIKSIYRKLEVNSRGEAVFEAIQRGIITLS